MKENKTLEITVLGSGTSTGVPVVGCKCDVCVSENSRNKRLRSSILIRVIDSDKVILIDTTPDLRYQLLREDISKIDHILFTHTHADHLHGFDDLRALYFHMKRPIHCWGYKEHLADLKTRFSYAFQKTGYPGTTPSVTLHEINQKNFSVEPSFEIESLSLPHGSVNSIAFRIGSFAYATDFKLFPQDAIEQWRGKITHMIASGATLNPHPTHSSLPETMDLFKALGVQKGFVTHLSHQINYEKKQELLLSNIFLAYDGLKFEV